MKEGNPIPSFDEDILIQLCLEVHQILAKENNIINIEGDVIVVGDIHGSLHDLLRILKFIQDKKAKVLFLGDYVDRGCFSLECITILFSMKVMHPDSIFLIRGNHEFDSLCSQYGFKDEILNYHSLKNPENCSSLSAKPLIKKSQSLFELNHIENEYYERCNDMYCYKYTETLYDAFINAFSYLPICAIINKATFCIHGGLSPKLNHVDDINKHIKRPISDFEENDLLSDVIWSDPAHCNSLFDENPRGKGYLFNREATATFIKNNNLTRIIRAHECVANGSLKNFGDKCITVFSASSYDKQMGNSSSILEIFQKDDSITVTTFEPLQRLQKSEAFYYKVQSLKSNEEKTQYYFSLHHPTLPSCINLLSNKSSKHKSENLFILKTIISKPRTLINPKFTTNQRKSCQIMQNKTTLQ